jgi:putative nucleotidyltransferase with HDIG domain
MADMNDILHLERLPAMPAAAARAIPLLMDPETPLEALERVVRRDEGLTAAVLRTANSAMYGTPGRHYDLRRAMVRLGRDALRRCILEHRVSGVVGGENAAFGLPRGALWRSALAGAIAAEELARQHRSGEAALAYTCGLLRDIGKLALNARFGADYLSQIQAHLHPGRTFAEAEREALGFDHAQVGAALARRWHLPDRIARAIEWHHDPPPPGPDHDPIIDLVHAADMIVRWAGLGVGLDGLEYRLADHVRASLRLDRRSAEQQIALVWDKLREAEQLLGEAGTQGAAA